jgi:V/A-type H+/Na+-transporting ATPase subunit E
MTTIEDKIKLFSNVVYDRIKEEKQKDFQRFEEEKKRAVGILERQLEEKKSSVLSEANKRADLKANEIISAEKIRNQQAILELKNKLVDETIMEIRKRLINFTKSDEYHVFLVKQVKSTFSKLERGEYILFLKHDDAIRYGNEALEEIKKINEMSITINEASDEIIGGLLVKSILGKFRINNSIAERLDDFKGKVGLMVTERLGGEAQQK